MSCVEANPPRNSLKIGVTRITWQNWHVTCTKAGITVVKLRGFRVFVLFIVSHLFIALSVFILY